MQQSPEQIKGYLSDSLSAGRLKHTFGVVEAAILMAKEYGADQNKAEIAALLHDIAKEYKGQKLLEEAKRFNIELNNVDIQSPHILHARVGACTAKEKFNIQDTEILDAIANHTLGRPNMHLLEKILFVADATELNRPINWAEPIREILKSDGIDAAVIKCCENTINEVTEKKFLLHPLTIDTYNFYVSNNQ